VAIWDDLKALWESIKAWLNWFTIQWNLEWRVWRPFTDRVKEVVVKELTDRFSWANKSPGDLLEGLRYAADPQLSFAGFNLTQWIGLLSTSWKNSWFWGTKSPGDQLEGLNIHLGGALTYQNKGLAGWIDTLEKGMTSSLNWATAVEAGLFNSLATTLGLNMSHQGKGIAEWIDLYKQASINAWSWGLKKPGDQLEGLNQMIAKGMTYDGRGIGEQLEGTNLFLNAFGSSVRDGQREAALLGAQAGADSWWQLFDKGWGARLGSLWKLVGIDGILAPKSFSDMWGNFKNLPGQYLSWLSAQGGTNLALNPERALATIGPLSLMAMSAGTGAHFLSTILNIVPTLNWVGASQLAGYIAQVAGFDPIINASYGPLIDASLNTPLRYHWQKHFRPNIPTEGAVFMMGRKRGLNPEEFRQAMSFHGLPDWWIDKEYGFFWTDPSPYWLLRMSENATPKITSGGAKTAWLNEWLPGWASDDWAWFKMKLMLAGFEDIDIGPFIEGFKSRRTGTAITQVKTSIRAMIREGYWGREEAKERLEELGVRPEEIDLIYTAEEIDYQNRYNDDQVMYYIESYRKGELSRQDLSLGLATMIVQPQRVAQIVAREEVRALPKPKAIVEPKEDPLVKSLVTQAINSWTKAYRAWEISDDDLALGLRIVVQNDVLAAQMVATERTRYRPPPPPPAPPKEDPLIAASRRASIASWIGQYRDGKISADVLELALTNLIPDPTIVKQVRQLEELRARPTPDIIAPWEEDPVLAQIREETVRAHIEMFRKRMISVQQLYTMLIADGLVEALARSTAVTQALKRIKVPSLESPYFESSTLRMLTDQAAGSYLRMLQLGEITQAQYEQYLAGAGVDAAVVTYLGDTQSLQAFLRAVPL